jgi:hypothetical protein
VSEKGCSIQESWNLAERGRKVLNMKPITACLLIMAFCMPVVAQQKEPGQITVNEATQLVLAALPSKTKQLPKFGLEGGLDSSDPRFYMFEAYWAGAPNGSMVIGNYAVDASTADVWNAPAACDELSTPALRKFQKQVRSRIRLSPTEYRKKKRRCPLELEDNQIEK